MLFDVLQGTYSLRRTEERFPDTPLVMFDNQRYGVSGGRQYLYVSGTLPCKEAEDEYKCDAKQKFSVSQEGSLPDENMSPNEAPEHLQSGFAVLLLRIV